MSEFFTLLRAEWRAILADRAILLTLFGGVLLYSFLYPQPYLQQLPREERVVLVDEDNSQLSRQLAFMADATPQVALVAQVDSVTAARALILTGQARGMLLIPRHFYRDLRQGKAVTISYSGDASYFLVYGTIVEGLSQASGTLAAQIKVAQLLTGGEPHSRAQQGWSAVGLNLVPVFNPSMGYINYVVPAVFVLILQQVMLMASAILGASQNGQQGYWQRASIARLYAARVLILTLLSALPASYFFGFCLEHYGVPRHASPWAIWGLIIPFLIATINLGIALGALFNRKEQPAQVVLLSSLPLVFLAGFIWPKELIPDALNLLAQGFPTISAISGFLRLNQMAASAWQIRTDVGQLWLLAALYGLLAYSLLRWRQQRAMVNQRV